jgi:hypothetical protein
MIALNRFFINPFDDVNISDDELRTFAEDHLGRLSAANSGGEFTQRLTDTTAKFNAFFGNVSSEELKVALQKAATQTMNTRWTAFVSYMTIKGEARIVDRAGNPSALYTQFFPRGLTEFHTVKVADALSLADRTNDLATANVATLGQDFADLVTQLVTDYSTARSAQVTLKGETVDAGADRRAGHDALTLQLFDNLLFLAQRHKGDPAAANGYFNQSLLEDAQPTTPVPPAPPGP